MLEIVVQIEGVYAGRSFVYWTENEGSRIGGGVEIIVDGHLIILYITCVGLQFMQPRLVGTVKISN
jgi:hypothetical protein